MKRNARLVILSACSPGRCERSQRRLLPSRVLSDYRRRMKLRSRVG